MIVILPAWKRQLMAFLTLASLCLWHPGMAQERSVSGTVREQNSGDPIPGVSVVLKGTTVGTVTDFDGKFTINAPDDAVLVFSFIGYETHEIAVGGQSEIEVSMAEDVTTLEQVVVVGYGTQRKKDLTTAVVTVSEKDIQDRPLVSAAEALQGKAAGVQVVQPSGKPGADLSVRVRGSTSVLAGNEPLYVVDGVPTTDIRGLNPSDIASMSILKDASSAAIYGARAANGVVLITTRRGETNAPTVRFSAYSGFSTIGKTPDVLNTMQYRELMEEVLGPGTVDPSITNYTNWNDVVFGTGKNQNYQVSFSGGNEASHYFISGGYLKADGIVEPASFDRYSIRLNLDNQLKDWLKIGTSINFLNSKAHNTEDNASSGRGGVIMSALNTPPFLNIYNPDGSGQFDPNPFQPSWENPVAYMEGPEEETVENRLIGNVNADIKLAQDLSFKTNLGVDITSHQWDYYLDPLRTNNGRQENGVGAADKSNTAVWLWENTLTYSRTIGEDHNVTGLAGMSTQESNWGQSYISVKDFPKNTAVKTLNVANQINSAYTLESEWALASYFARVNYDFKGKYLLTANFRRDGSSKLAPDNRWGNFPSISAGWRISAEPFMSGAQFIDDLKLRVGWGKNGNQEGIANYASYGLHETSRRPITDPLSGPALRRINLENKDLKWETTTQTNVGVDLSVLASRIIFSADAYIKQTEDLLLNVPLPSTVGIDYITMNAGKIENKGIEFSVSSVNTQGQLRWNTDFNISFNRNTVEELELAEIYNFGRVYSNNQDVVIVKPGLPLGSFYGYVAEGVNPDTGDMVFTDFNDNGIIDPDDRRVIGNAQPDFVYGLTNTLSFKRFDLTVFFQGSQGNDIYNATRIDLEGMFDSKNQSTVVLDRWTENNRDTDIPRPGQIGNVRNSTRFVEDGSYLRLKSVTLTYNLNPAWLQKIGIGALSVYATGQNLLTFTDYSGFDPEVNAFGRSAVELGIDYGTYPQSKTVIFGVNVEF